MSAEFLTSDRLGVPHGFFTRRGGVSRGPYASLNCSLSSGDDPASILRNRALVAEALCVAPARLLGVTQVHGIDVVTVEAPWAAGEGARADAMVTRHPGLALGVITADCAPVLFADEAASVIGAAHAGWRGAAAGVLEATIAAMESLGASRPRINAVIGPCIAQASYEVAADMRGAVCGAVCGAVPGSEIFFAQGVRADHWQFDLAGYCLARLHAASVNGAALYVDTCTDEERFFSHRRRTLRREGPIGHQVSVIRI